MARLIDANKIKYRTVGSGGWNQPENVVSDYEIEKMPTVDAAEVVHGRWINKTNVIHGQVDYMFVCSACGNIYWDSTTDSFDYCPNCGAKMDGKERK